jgi:hypothetical protein
LKKKNEKFPRKKTEKINKKRREKNREKPRLKIKPRNFQKKNEKILILSKKTEKIMILSKKNEKPRKTEIKNKTENFSKKKPRSRFKTENSEHCIPSSLRPLLTISPQLIFFVNANK